jgi:hypothetical protein
MEIVQQFAALMDSRKTSNKANKTKEMKPNE